MTEKFIDKALLSILRSISNVTAQVGDRIRVDKLEQGDTLPNIVIELTDDQGESDLESSFGGGRIATISIRVRADKRAAANRIAATISGYLDSLLEEQVDNIVIEAVDFGSDSNEIEPEDDSDLPGYVRPFEITVFYH
jgi:hypothetical protein